VIETDAASLLDHFATARRNHPIRHLSVNASVNATSEGVRVVCMTLRVVEYANTRLQIEGNLGDPAFGAFRRNPDYVRYGLFTLAISD
jgi:hypothetical protein